METFSSLETPAGQRALKCLLLYKVCRGLNNVTVQLVEIASRAYDTFVWSSYVCICMQRFLLTLSGAHMLTPMPKTWVKYHSYHGDRASRYLHTLTRFVYISRHIILTLSILLAWDCSSFRTDIFYTVTAYFPPNDNIINSFDLFVPVILN